MIDKYTIYRVLAYYITPKKSINTFAKIIMHILCNRLEVVYLKYKGRRSFVLFVLGSLNVRLLQYIMLQ